MLLVAIPKAGKGCVLGVRNQESWSYISKYFIDIWNMAHPALTPHMPGPVQRLGQGFGVHAMPISNPYTGVRHVHALPWPQLPIDIKETTVSHKYIRMDAFIPSIRASLRFSMISSRETSIQPELYLVFRLVQANLASMP